MNRLKISPSPEGHSRDLDQIDEALAKLAVHKLLSTPSRILFTIGSSVAEERIFAVMRREVGTKCAELGLSAKAEALAQTHMEKLLRDGLDSLFRSE